MRLGYFGGSFDPPHLGHLAVVQAAADNFALDRVLMVPTANQPLKPGGAVASYDDRLAMVSLLCQADPRLRSSRLEAPAESPTPNYTIDTLRRIRAEEPETEVFVIVGADAFQDLPRWCSPEQLLSIAEWIVVTRPSLTAEFGDDASSALRPPSLTPEQQRHVHLLATVNNPASATAIRAELALGHDCAQLLPPEVITYIREQRLYAWPRR